MRHAVARFAATFLALSASALPAQPPAASGIARDARLGTPLACLHVALLDSAQKAVAHAVTDAAGTFVLVAPGAGVYRVGFEILGWERLLGPADTLRDGEMRERVYPLAFEDAPGPDGLPAAELRRREGALWRSAVAATPDADIRFPRALRGTATSGNAVAQYVVDSAGRVRADSWRPISTTHPEFLAALRAHAPAMRYEPARLEGRAVCQLVRNHVRFESAGLMPTVSVFN
ncbi:MAG TPA: hypothetical protein VFS59_00460 [Gemmatimonadaceae bacterium]|nr:hypothetical protein [Gemmatimonadaceae bacterium]